VIESAYETVQSKYKIGGGGCWQGGDWVVNDRGGGLMTGGGKTVYRPFLEQRTNRADILAIMDNNSSIDQFINIHE